MIWNGIERFGSSLFLFISNLILARLLSPDDFGCIGMLLVFISVSDAIIDGGFGSALIQKKNPTQVDYSTIFYWNIVLSIALYFVLYFSAPFIADFYEIEIIASILKIQGIVLVINALYLIQKNILIKQISFKRVAKVNLFGIIIGSVIGIVFAFIGFGVWSLVIKSLSTAVLQCITYWVMNKWKPSWIFSWQSFTSLFKFGSFMFLTVVFNTLYHNLLSLIIGKSFSPSTLGYFTQAKKLEDLPRSSLSSVATNVSFPVFSEIQNDKERLLRASQKLFTALMFLNIPLMLLLIVCAEPLIDLLFTSKWEQSVPYFQVLCVYGIFVTPTEINNQLIKSLGKSNLTLYIVVTYRIVGLILSIGGLIWGMNGLLIGYTFSGMLGYFISSFVLGKFLDYGLWKQLRDIIPIVIIASITTYLSSFLLINNSQIGTLLVQSLVFLIIYLILSIVFKVKGKESYFDLLKSKFIKN